MRCDDAECPWWRGPVPAALDTSDWTDVVRSDPSMDDELKFEHRAIDNPVSVTYESCVATVALPTTDPWLIVGGQTAPPRLVSMRCPHCRGRIYLHSVSDEERARDAVSDALADDDDDS